MPSMSIQPGEREKGDLQCLLRMARDEDLGPGDVTSALLPEGLAATAQFVAREPLVVCGAALLAAIAQGYDPRIETRVHVAEGKGITAGTVLADWSGPARGMLSAERVALNFLQRLCGIATVARRYVSAVADTNARICDTRKTTPGWRHLEKYAVRCGGGRNHRAGLYDAVLVKDNHLAALAAAGEADPLAALGAALPEARASLREGGFVEVEVDTLGQLARALTLDVDVILLDNMSPEDLRRAVAMRDEAGKTGRIDLEASGGITLETVNAVAATGVDTISVGALTHSATAVDIALDIAFG